MGRYKHGHKSRKNPSPEYRAWISLKERCYNKNFIGYAHYGGRGISVCSRWLKPGAEGFENFLSDMGYRPSEKHSLDRRNNNKNYTKSNCRWATKYIQLRNQRSNRTLKYKGKEYIVTDLAAKLNISPNQLFYNLNRGRSIEDIINFINNRSDNQQYHNTQKKNL